MVLDDVILKLYAAPKLLVALLALVGIDSPMNENVCVEMPSCLEPGRALRARVHSL